MELLVHVDRFGVIHSIIGLLILLIYEDLSPLVSQVIYVTYISRVIERVQNQLMVSDELATRRDSNLQSPISSLDV